MDQPSSGDAGDHGAGTPDAPDAAGAAGTAEAFLTASRALVSIAVRSIELTPIEVTVAQHRVLVLLAARGPSTVGDLADGLGVNPSNATRICDRLQRLGLVSRTRSTQDGRVVVVALTEAGAAVVADVTTRRRVDIVKVLARMTPGERERVVEALDAFSRAAGEIADRDWASLVW